MDMLDDSEPGPLELKLEELEVNEEAAKMMCEALLMRSDFLFKKAESEEHSLLRIWYKHRARWTQRRAMGYQNEAEKNLDQYLLLRDQSIADIRKTADILSYQAKLEPTPPAP
jgi:hypothetical protein